MTEASDDAIRRALGGTLLAGRPIQTLAITQSDELARWVPGDHETDRAAWPAVRDAVVPLGLWPVLTDLPEEGRLSRASFPVPDDRPWSERRADPRPGRSVADLLDEAAGLTKRTALAAFRSGRARRDADEMGDPARVRQRVERECSWTDQTLGRAPTIDEALEGIGPTPSEISIERWFLDWEDANRSGEIAVPFELYEPRCEGILLVPTRHPWEVFAYLSWFGAERELAAPMVALARSWYERFGAEVRTLWGYGTWMDVAVASPPRTLGEAFELADEQVLAAADTAIDVGIWTVRGLARHLVDEPRWVLSARP